MRRVLRISAWTLGSLLALVVLLVAALLIAGNTARGRALIERVTERVTDGHVRLAGLAGSFPGAIELERLQLADEQGVWLTAEHLALHWSPLALLRRHVQVAELALARVVIERRPISQPSSSSSPRPPRVDVHRFAIDTLELGPQLAGSRARLALQGSAHLVSLQDASGSLSARRTDGVGGNYQLTLRMDPEQVQASLKLDEPAGGALGNLLQVPDLGALAVLAQLSGPRSAERVTLDAQAGELRAHAHGSIDLHTPSADLDYRLEAAAMAPAPNLSWQRIALAGRWHGPLSAPRADGQLLIQALQLPGGAGVGTLEAALDADSSTISLHATAAGLVLPGPQPRLLAESPLRTSAVLSLKEAAHPLQVTAQHRLFSLQARALTSGTRSASFSLRLPELAPLAVLAGQQLRGSSELKGALSQGSSATRLEVQADSEIEGEASAVAALLANRSRLQIAVTLSEHTVELERLTLNGRALTVSASGRGERGGAGVGAALQSLRARYEVNLTNIGVLSAALAGTAKIEGQIDGAITSLATQMQVSSNLSVRGSPAETVRADIRARGLPARLSATLAVRGRFAAAPLQLDAALERSGDTYRLSIQRSEWKSARLEGELTSGANGAPGHGNLNLRMDHLEDLQALLGEPIAGSLSGNLTLKPAERHTQAQLRLEARDLVVANVSANARLLASGSSDALSLQLSAQSADVQGAPASLDCNARLNLSARELGLQRVEVRYHQQSLHLVTPARVTFADGLAIHRLRLALQRAIIEVDGRVSPTLDAHVSARQIDAQLVNAFAPGTLSRGTLDVDARLQGATAAPTGVVTMNATGLRLGSDTLRNLQALEVHASAQLQGNTAQLDVRLAAGTESQLKIAGTVPLTTQGALSLKLNGKLDAALANPILEARAERATGVLTVNATVSGTARAPTIGGTIDLAHGDLRDYTQGLHLSDVSAQLTGSQGMLNIASFSARAAPGQLSMTGTIGVLQPGLPLDLRLTAKNAQPITSDILTANLNADLRLQGKLRERLDLSGTINLNRTLIGIPNSLPPEVAVLDVRRPGQAPPAPPETKRVIALDLQLHAPREILVQGRGLNAELGGDLRLRGTTDSPRVGGGFDMIRGTFALASTHLNFTSGRVSFNGAGLRGKIDPTLDFTAQSTVAGVTATLKVTGFADAPQFDLSSSPQLPQDEILARLLFGESAAQLTALQAAQIGAALASLSGVGGGGLNPLAKVQKALGLDRLSVGGGSNGPGGGAQNSGTSVEAGRYVSNRVFVGAKQSSAGFSQVEVDVELSKHLKLQTRLGNGANTQGTTQENDPGSSVAVLYQFEY